MQANTQGQICAKAGTMANYAKADAMAVHARANAIGEFVTENLQKENLQKENLQQRKSVIYNRW